MSGFYRKSLLNHLKLIRQQTHHYNTKVQRAYVMAVVAVVGVMDVFSLVLVLDPAFQKLAFLPLRDVF